MISTRVLFLLMLLTGGLLSGCTLLSELKQTITNKDTRLQDALEDYTSAKSASQRKNGDAAAQEKLAQARETVEDTALETADQQRTEGNWFQARQILDTALEQIPDSQRLQRMRQDIETERSQRLRINDCRLGAARARFLVDKSALLQARSPLEGKDFLQDWQSRREHQELDQLAVQLRDCADQALDDRRLELAEETLNAATLIHDDAFVAEQRRRLDLLKNPPPPVAEAKPAAPKPAVKKPVEETPLQKARQARMALQSAMTRGDLLQAKASIAELRRLEGDTPQLQELEKSINDAIAANIAEMHEKANELYRGRQIVQARDLWQKILELDPNDAQARTNLDRAERVLKKLEELEGAAAEVVQPTPATPTPPPSSAP